MNKIEPKIVAQAVGTFLTGLVGVLALAAVDIGVSAADIDEFVIALASALAGGQTLVGFVVGWYRKSKYSRTSIAYKPGPTASASN